MSGTVVGRAVGICIVALAACRGNQTPSVPSSFLELCSYLGSGESDNRPNGTSIVPSVEQ